MLWLVNSEADPSKTVSLESLKNGIKKLGYSGFRVLSLRQVSREAASNSKVEAILYSGSGALWSEYENADFAPTKALLEAPPCPVLGICGGHQLLGKVLGAECAPMKCSKPLSESWTYADCEQEDGFKDVFVRVRDVLFTGLPSRIRVRENHYEELKQLPAGFICTAWNEQAAIQAMRHRSLPIFGTQFHPELFSQQEPDGAQVLKNFLQYARAHT